jgi:diguanylate cyclase (GGDEF)-like protein
LKDKINFLIIANEAAEGEMFGSFLAKEGYRVAVAQTGNEAQKHLAEDVFNFVILDLKISDLDTLELVRSIKKSNPFMSVLVITDEADLTKAILAVKEGASSYIIKPISMDTFEVAIEKCLESQRQIIANIQLLQQLKQKKEKTDEILRICEMMNSITDLDNLVHFIITEVSRFLEARRASLMMVEEGLQYLVIKAAKGIDDNIIKSTKIRIGDGIAGWVAQEGKPWLVEDIETDSRIKQRNKPNYITKSFMCLPIRMENKIRGVLNISDKMNSAVPSFTEEDLKLTTIIVRQAGTALQNCYLHQKIDSIDFRDNLTGIFNRKCFYERLEEEIARLHRYKSALSLVMLDVDYFREYNDRVGHMMGNTIIKEISYLIKQNIRGVDTLARYEGGCFAVILPETPAENAQIVAEKIRKAINEYPFPKAVEQPGGKVTISGGVAGFSQDITKEELVNRAYQALLTAKKAAEKNTICIYT